MPAPRNSDEAPDWDDDAYIDLAPVLQRLDLLEDTLFDNLTYEPTELDQHETN